MTRVIAAELLKLRTTRTFYGVTLGALALVGLISTAASAVSTFDAHDPAVTDMLAIAALAQTFALVLGILAVSTEFRHGTLTPTLLTVPDRVRLVLAKLAAHTAAGLALGAVACALCAALVLGILSAREIDPRVDGGEIAAFVAGGAAATALFAALGVGLGALVRNQVGAIVGALAYLLAIEPILAFMPGIHESVQRYGLTGAAGAMTGTSGDPTIMLDPVPASLLLTAYAAAFIVLGIATLRRRDIGA
jgi:ABC-2 type transport system permease protein